ncbi:NINE protein [Agromyces sp. MMS24-JH15]|uniref:NINE protein n=1 Tax=Agromyces sp. MMS24-JH15 TaxID=3243765 RepID=UPI0037478421
MSEPAPTPPSGWYAEPSSGHLRWWDGTAWGPYAPPQQAAAPPVYYAPPSPGLKESAVAYVFAIFLGGFGAHRFYLGAIPSAVTQLCLTILGIATSAIVVGGILLLVVGIWVIVDLFLIPGEVRYANARIEADWAIRDAAGVG